MKIINPTGSLFDGNIRCFYMFLKSQQATTAAASRPPIFHSMDLYGCLRIFFVKLSQIVSFA